jgi:hypothetical protein
LSNDLIQKPAAFWNYAFIYEGAGYTCAECVIAAGIKPRVHSFRECRIKIMSSLWGHMAQFGGDTGFTPVIGANLQELLRHIEE